MVFRTNIFTFIPVIMILYIYIYWFKMLKWWKFLPLIKACASSTNCTMGNLTCSRHTAYLHTIYMYFKSREIHIISTIYKSLVILRTGSTYFLNLSATKFQIWWNVWKIYLRDLFLWNFNSNDITFIWMYGVLGFTHVSLNHQLKSTVVIFNSYVA